MTPSSHPSPARADACTGHLTLYRAFVALPDSMAPDSRQERTVFFEAPAKTPGAHVEKLLATAWNVSTDNWQEDGLIYNIASERAMFEAGIAEGDARLLETGFGSGAIRYAKPSDVDLFVTPRTRARLDKAMQAIATSDKTRAPWPNNSGSNDAGPGRHGRRCPVTPFFKAEVTVSIFLSGNTAYCCTDAKMRVNFTLLHAEQIHPYACESVKRQLRTFGADQATLDDATYEVEVDKLFALDARYVKNSNGDPVEAFASCDAKDEARLIRQRRLLPESYEAISKIYKKGGTL